MRGGQIREGVRERRDEREGRRKRRTVEERGEKDRRGGKGEVPASLLCLHSNHHIKKQECIEPTRCAPVRNKTENNLLVTCKGSKHMLQKLHSPCGHAGMLYVTALSRH